MDSLIITLRKFGPMVENLRSLKRKSRTALNLIRNGEFQRFSSIVLGRLESRVPISRLSITPSLRQKSKGQNFRALAAKTKQPLALRSAVNKPIVACVLDEFSVISWQEEFELIELPPNNWKKEVENKDIDFFFCESAWRGKGEMWKGLLNQPGQSSTELADIVEFFKKKRIPTAFWNKEDPPYFEEFKANAALFDVVFTTDSQCVAAYESLPGNREVYVLPFAAQPALHNPARNNPQIPGFPRERIHQGGIAFAGTYFADRFPERKKQMDTILEAARQAAKRSDEEFTIFSRMGSMDKRYSFPSAFKSFVAGSLPYSKMLSAFQEHKIFLNVNTVTSSPSMCARRIFEIPASGSLVVSTPSDAIRTFFPEDSIPIVDDIHEGSAVLSALLRSKILRDKKVHKAQREIWNNQTYAHRAAQILTTLGISQPEPNPSIQPKKVSVIASTIRPERLSHLFEQVGRQVNVDVELLVGTHGFSVKDELLKELLDSSGLSLDQVHLMELSKDLTLGACLNKLVEMTSMPLVAKMDDDDSYLPHYLEDLANALFYSGADLVGKQAVYVHLESDELILRHQEKEHIFTNFVVGPTLFGYQETFLNNPFEERTTGEDSAFLKSVLDNGGKIYAADRFNFIQERAGSHTWNLSTSQFLENGSVETWGVNEKHVSC